MLRLSLCVTVLCVTLSCSAHAETRYTTIVIDPGHGGFDRGGIPGQRVAEKVMTLDVSQRLKTILQNAGYRVVMTRDTDEFIPLGTRVAIANSQPPPNANPFTAAIHFNSATRRGANGIETYFYSTESAPLAASIHASVLGGAPSENRGVRRRGYFVLRRTNIPAVLVECGFLTNPNEAQYAENAAYRQKLAQNIARGILNRPAVASRTSYTNRSSRVDVGSQPFLDQRYVREASGRSGKSSHRRKIASATRKRKKTSVDD